MYMHDVRNRISLLIMNTFTRFITLMAENGVPGSGNAVLLVHRVRDLSERQKDRLRTGHLHVAISHAANPTFSRVPENNNVIDTTATANPGLNSHQPTSVSGSTVTGLNLG